MRSPTLIRVRYPEQNRQALMPVLSGKLPLLLHSAREFAMPIRHCIVHLIEKTGRHTCRSPRPRFGAGRIAGHGEPAGGPQRKLQRQAGQGLGLLPRRIRRLSVQRLAGAIHGRHSGLHRLQPPGRGTPAEADGRVQSVHRWSRAVRPLPAGHDRLPGHRPAASQRRRGGDRVAGCGASQASGSGPAASGSTHQHFRVAEQQAVEAVHLLHQGQERQEGLRVLPRFHRLPGGRRCPGETRTLLKAFSDYVESEDLPEEQAREKTSALVDYASTQAARRADHPRGTVRGDRRDRPRAFYEHIRNKDYGLSPEIPPDKRTLNQFRRFTGRAEGCRSASNRTCWARRSNTTRTATC